MGTQDKPDITIDYYNGSSWVNITPYARHFSIADAGLLKVPLATIDFGTLPTIPNINNLIRIWANTTGTNYMPFYGRVAPKLKTPTLGTISKYEIQLTAYGLEKRLDKDEITWKYFSEQSAYSPSVLWSFKDMILDFLKIPDSGYDTGFVLDTDSNEILNAVFGDCDFERTSLLDGFRTVAETIGYDGYVWLDGAIAKVKFVKLGTLASSPATTLTDPFVRKPQHEWNPDDIMNYILTWGGVDEGWPSDGDRFTEKAITKYPAPNNVWEALTSETLTDTPYDSGTATGSGSNYLRDISKSWTADQWVNYYIFITEGKGESQLRMITSNSATDIVATKDWTVQPDTTSKYILIGGYNIGEDLVAKQSLSRYAINIPRPSGGTVKLRFHAERTGVSSVDLQEHFTSINFNVFSDPMNFQLNRIQLTDTGGHVVEYETWEQSQLFGLLSSHMCFGGSQWQRITIPSLDQEIFSPNSRLNKWRYVSPATTFDGKHTKYIDLWLWDQETATTTYRLDKFNLAGGKKIDPFENPHLYPKYYTQNGDPASFDQTSIDTYGLSLYPHINQNISSFQQAQDEGDRILAVMKDLIETVTVTKKGYEWLRPTQTVTLNSVPLGISNETWRILDLSWEWFSGHPLYNTIKLVPQNAKTPPVYSPRGEIPSPNTIIPNYATGGYRGSHTQIT